MGEGNFEETINEVNAVGRRGAQRGLEKEPRNGVAAVGANTLENEQTRTRRQGTHTFPRGERCTRTYVPAFTFPFNSNMHALVNFIILASVVATSVWQSPLFSNRNGYPKTGVLVVVLRRSQRGLSRGKDQGFDIRRAFQENCLDFKIIECLNLVVILFFFFFFGKRDGFFETLSKFVINLLLIF